LDRYFFGKDKLGDLASKPPIRTRRARYTACQPQLFKGVYGVVDLAGLKQMTSSGDDPI